MSAPSTATATNPTHHLHYRYPLPRHHPPPYPTAAAAAVYEANAAAYEANAAFVTRPPRTAQAFFPPSANPPASASSARAAATSSTRPPPPPPPAAMPAPHSPPSTRERQKRHRTPDWKEFFKNGLPKEFIVINDTPPPDAGPPSAGARAPSARTSRAAALADGAQHVHKKRKTAGSGTGSGTGYDGRVGSREAAAAITARVPASGSVSAITISTDRTTSALHTTAPTSLGSHYSQNGLSHEPFAGSQVAGQKRKRTRKQLADEAKRVEMERQGDAYSSYHPPPKPPIKAVDVHVAIVPDRQPLKPHQVDDEDGHYIVRTDTDLTDRYQISRLLGQGTFGKVVEAYDRRKRSKCAIKIIRSVQKYRDASRIELRVLETLASNDRENRNKCIHLRDCFDFRNHICIVTDLLGQSVFDFLKANSFVPFPNSHIQSFARQLFTSVAFLHDLNLIHTDLKPENILLVDGTYQTFTYNRTIPSSSTTVSRTARHRKVLLDTEIRLIDFGSATFQDEYHSSIVSTRHYRAPEIILGLGWSYPCDIWSIGCILVEFFTGDALFQTHDNIEHLAMMESICGGKIEPRLIRKVNSTRRGHACNPAVDYFLRNTRLNFPHAETTKASKKYVKAMKRLTEIIPATTRFNKLFLDLLRRIFYYDPLDRLSAKEALQHDWFKETTVDDGSEAARLRMERSRERLHER
ncbi:MAG: dual specificity protein kinase kns1 [Phylliscum demangeonii]|nr:MAG: dual specificity protein kinase kns1 [Phylliscum demangeonii]